MRGRFLRALRAEPGDARTLKGLFGADSLWGIAAVLWLLTGLGRTFGSIEKQTDFYLRNGMFWVKMAMFVTILLLELRPMITFIRWRIAKSSGKPLAGIDNVGGLILLNDLEVALLALMPFVAAAMARGVWMF
jgi:putative membrane protein